VQDASSKPLERTAPLAALCYTTSNCLPATQGQRSITATNQAMLDIAKAILDAAKAILGLADQLKTAGRQQRAEIADLFNKISACPAATSSEIRAGEITHGRWVS